MCKWTQREYSCGHCQYIVAYWCNTYRMKRSRRCSMDVAHYEFREDECCSACRPRQPTPQYSAYITSICKHLREKYPTTDWQAIQALAEPGTTVAQKQTTPKRRKTQDGKRWQ